METGGYNYRCQDTPKTYMGKTAQKLLKLLCFISHVGFLCFLNFNT